MLKQESRLEVSVRLNREGFEIDVDFVVDSEILVLFGPSGSGKTSVLHTVAGLVDPDQGNIRFNNETWFNQPEPDQLERKLPTRRRNLGMVFQNRALFPHLTALDNVNYGVNDEERARYWLSKVELPDQHDQYPEQLSGGQQQRVALARALATEPRVLLLDEPFVSLDYRLSKQLNEVIQQVHEERNLPVVVVTHDQATALRLGHRVVILEGGCQVGTVTHQALRNEAVSSRIQDVFGPV